MNAWSVVLAEVIPSAESDNTVTITTIIVAAIVQITLAFFAFLTAKKANAKADVAAVKADRAAEVNDATHKIVNQQRSDMVAEIELLKAHIASLKEGTHPPVRKK